MLCRSACAVTRDRILPEAPAVADSRKIGRTGVLLHGKTDESLFITWVLVKFSVIDASHNLLFILK